jgi:hypothetical protein
VKAKKPAWLSQDTNAYVDAVLRRQKHTVTALVEAGMTEYGIRLHCEVAVNHTQEMPPRIDSQKVLANRAVATLSALNTVRAFIPRLYATDASLIQRMDEEQVTNVLDQIEREARRVKPPQRYGALRQTGQNDAAKRWTAVRVAIGLLGWFVRRDTGSPNEALVANLANELFAGAAPQGQTIDEDLIRRCRKATDETMGAGSL